MMRICRAAVFAIAVLGLGAVPALAVEPEQAAAQEQAAPAPSDVTKPPMMLGSPSTAADEAAAKRKSRIFGILPRLNFGLELMYGEQPKPVENKDASMTEDASKAEDAGKTEDEKDVGFLGRLKRLF